jgi:hypothetical protein
MPLDRVPGQSALWIYRLDPHEIHYLKFTLEAYEGMAMLTTLDSQAGVVQLSVPPGREVPVQALMKALGREIELKRVGPAEQDALQGCC